MCGKIVGTTLNDLNDLDLYKARTWKKAELIMNDPSHPLQNVFKLLLLLTDIICLYVGPIDLKTRLYQMPSVS